MIKAAGILFFAQGKVLLLKRSSEGDHAREWALPGGKQEDGENADQAARRELTEECGVTYTGELTPIMHTDDGNVDFTTFLTECKDQFIPKLNDENTAFLWANIEDYPNRTHPAVKALLDSDAVKSRLNGEEIKADSSNPVITELDIAKNIRDGVLPSPQKIGNLWLFAIRISGTGLSYRPELKEYVDRSPDNYLNDEFLARCNGLPVIWKHPKGNKLDSQSFSERVIGTVFLPYVSGEEVWGIAKVFDDDAGQIMDEHQLSTSPGVTFQAGTNVKQELKDGSSLLIEGNPKLVDHIAIVENGVWDKGGAPSGVLSENAQVVMTEASRGDSSDQPDSTQGDIDMDEILALLKQIQEGQTGLITRVEALETKKDALPIEVEAKKADELPAPALNAPVAPAVKADDAVLASAAPVPAPAAEPASYVADKSRLDALEKELAEFKSQAKEPSEDKAKEFALAQKKADAIEQAYGDSARRPLRGESVMDYRKDLVKKHQVRSAKYKNVDIASITDANHLSIVEDEIYADSLRAASSVDGIADGVMIKSTVTRGGREITEYKGKGSFTRNFTPETALFRINPNPNAMH